MSTRRATRTPGAKEPEPILQDDSAIFSEEEAALVPVEQFDAVAEHVDQIEQVLENQKRIERKLDQLLKAGGVEAPKKKRFVLGESGYEEKEI